MLQIPRGKKTLYDLRLFASCLLSERGRVDQNFPPSQELYPFVPDNFLENLSALDLGVGATIPHHRIGSRCASVSAVASPTSKAE